MIHLTALESCFFGGQKVSHLQNLKLSMLGRRFLVELLTCERFQHAFSERMKRCGKLLFCERSHLPCAQSVENLRSTDVLI